MRQLHAKQIRWLVTRRIQRPEQLLVADYETVCRIERLQNVFAGTQSKSAQENRTQEFALAIDAHVENVLLVIFKLNPRSAVGNDLAQEIGAVRGRLEENAGRAVQLADDYSFCAVNNEGAVLRHQWNVAEEHFLLFNVADRAIAGLILVPDGQPHRDFERRGIGHAALFTLRHVILQLQSNRIAALITKVRSIRVICAALVTQNFAGMERVGDHR